MKIVHYARLTKLRQLSEIEFICQFVAPQANLEKLIRKVRKYLKISDDSN